MSKINNKNGSTGVNECRKVGDVHVIDLRSDTITQPPPGMREAMANAVVGDDVYGEDPTVKELESRCAKMFGKEAALFVPTGTMGNLLSILVHCQHRGLELIAGHKSHIILNEQAGMAQFGGVMPRMIKNLSDGTFDLDELKSLIRPLNDPHQPWTRLICIENSQNFCGGQALPLEFLQQVKQIAKENNLAVHMDGARVLNAALALGKPVSEVVQYADSVNMCFSKGLAAPVGSIVAGTKDFISMATRLRKALGGGWRQAGILAAAAIWALDNIVPRLQEDHEHAKMIAQEILNVNEGVVDINMKNVQTNIITVNVVKPGLTAADFCQRMKEVTEDELEAVGRPVMIKMNPIHPQVARILTHNDVGLDDIKLAIHKFRYVIQEFSRK